MDKILKDFKEADLTTPHNCNAAYMVSNLGVDIEEEHAFQEELHGIVDKMQEDLVHETKILEGTLEPVYQNELSDAERKEEQWKTDSPSGYSTIARTLTFNDESNTSFSTVSSLNRARVIHDSDEKSQEQSSPSCGRTWADCGLVTELLNESSDCMEQTINVPMLGIPSEEK